MTDQSILDRPERDITIEAFVGHNSGYYTDIFDKIQRDELPAWRINLFALIVPWLWASWRGIWLVFWLSLAVDVIALACLMQVVKFSPLLAEALQNPDANTTLIPRYTGWIEIYTVAGWGLFIAGRIWIGYHANRWYHRQYNRWRVIETVSSNVSARRVAIAIMVMLICVPITTYRASQSRLDGRACLNQTKAGEKIQDLLASTGAGDIGSLRLSLETDFAKAQSEFNRLEALDTLTDEQKTARSALRKEVRSTGRNVKVVDEYEAITQKDRFDCAFIDDFPTLTRIVPPGEVRYRRVPDEAAIAAGDPDATKVLIQQKDPIEGRRVNIFTYNAEAIDTSINYLRAQYASFFDATTHILRQSLINVEIAFMQTRGLSQHFCSLP